MSIGKNSSIASLVKGCQDGDKKAWNELVLRITPLVFSTCIKMGLSHEESFDVFGQVSYSLLDRLDKIKSSKAFFSYVSKMVRSEVYRLQESIQRFNRLKDSATEIIDVAISKTPEAIFDEAAMNQIVMEEVAKLPKNDYKLIQLLFFDPRNPSYEKIAKKLKIPISSIGPKRARCLAKLNKVIKKRFEESEGPE